MTIKVMLDYLLSLYLLDYNTKRVPRLQKFNQCSRNNQHYALICTTPLFYLLAPTCFGSSLPSSGSFFDQSELLEIQIDWVLQGVVAKSVVLPSWESGTQAM
jgi:hypothetical protein